MFFFLLCLLPDDDRYFFAAEQLFKLQGLGQLIQQFTLSLRTCSARHCPSSTNTGFNPTGLLGGILNSVLFIIHSVHFMVYRRALPMGKMFLYKSPKQTCHGCLDSYNDPSTW
jgi:hypothetical protein